MELNNPLRDKKRPLVSSPSNQASQASQAPSPQIQAPSPQGQASSTPPEGVETQKALPLAAKPFSTTPTAAAAAVPEYKPSYSEPARSFSTSTAQLEELELKRALELLAKKGILIAEPKKIWIKHSYEVEENAFERFHAMYSELGYKTVRDAITEALSDWCQKHHDEYKRRTGKAR